MDVLIPGPHDMVVGDTHSIGDEPVDGVRGSMISTEAVMKLSGTFKLPSPHFKKSEKFMISTEAQ